MFFKVASVVEWLKCCVYDQHGLSSKPTPTVLFCPWHFPLWHDALWYFMPRHFMALSPAWWSLQPVLSYS